MTGNTITGNTISGNSSGIYISIPSYSTDSGGTYSGNTFSGNTDYGLNYTGAGTLNAANDNWGDPSGPLDDSDDRTAGGLYNPGGKGDKVKITPPGSA